MHESLVSIAKIRLQVLDLRFLFYACCLQHVRDQQNCQFKEDGCPKVSAENPIEQIQS